MSQPTITPDFIIVSYPDPSMDLEDVQYSLPGVIAASFSNKQQSLSDVVKF